MAKNITLLGASYSDVPAVNLPQTGGGTARFTDTSPTTATDSDVASGKIYFKSDGSQSTGTSSGGGGGGGIEITQDAQGYIVLPKTGGGGGGDITVEALSVTQNGTYTAPAGKAYSPVTVNVSGGGGGTFGTIYIKNELSSTIKVWGWGVDGNGNTVGDNNQVSITAGSTGTIPILFHWGSTTNILGVLMIQCNYASTAQSATVTGASATLTYKIGTRSTYMYVYCAEPSGTTLTVSPS